MRKKISIGVLVVLAAAGWADEGAFEIANPCTITNPGSYVVTRDMASLIGSAIIVQANDVTLDLKGHTVSGGTIFSAHDGAIYQPSTCKNLAVRNGVIVGGWGPGIQAYGPGARVEAVSVRGSSGGGLLLGDAAAVADCAVFSNTLGSSAAPLVVLGAGSRISSCAVSGNRGTTLIGVEAGNDVRVNGVTVRENRAAGGAFTGIRVYEGAILDACLVVSNAAATALYGVDADAHASVQACVVKGNSTAAGSIFGIRAAAYARVLGCSVWSNRSGNSAAAGISVGMHGRVEACTSGGNVASLGYGFYLSTNVIAKSCVATANGSSGFLARNGCRLRRCVAKGNGTRGFAVYDWNQVEECVADNNGTSSADAGIEVLGNNNRILNNHVVDSYRGIVVSGSGNLVVGNSGVNAVTNFSIGAGNSYGAILDQPGLNFSETSPWVNFELQ